MVLIIDDSKLIRTRLSQMMREAEEVGSVIEAESVQEAASRLEHYRPQVIILDIQLTDGLGFEVLELLNEKGIECYTIVLTNYASQPYREKALRLGADSFLDKSNEFDRVYDITLDVLKKNKDG